MKKILALILALVMSLSLAACGKSTAETEDTANETAETEAADTADVVISGNTVTNTGKVDPNNFHVVVYRVPSTLDVFALGNTTCQALSQSIYDNLVTVDLDLNWQPNVATSWEQVDNVTWTFDIVEGYKFQNGEDLEMEDVVYSLTRLKDTNLMASCGSKIKDVTYEDRKVTVTLSEPDNEAMQQILNMGLIVNKSYIEEKGEDALNLEPIGTGPYVVTEYEPAAKIVMEAWDGYHGEQPDIKKIVIEGNEDASQRFIEVETSKSALANNLNWSYVQHALTNNEINLAQTFDAGCAAFVFNINEAPFNDIRVRQAFAYALDRDSWVEIAEGCKPVRSMIASYFNYYNESDNMPGYDIEKAVQLLEEAGYNSSNPLTFKCMHYMPNETALEFFQAQLATIGVNMEFDVCTSAVYNENVANGTFQCGYSRYMNRSVTPMEDLQMFETNGVKCHSGYSNAEVDELIKEIRSSTDEAYIKECFIKLQDIIATDLPMLPICAIGQFWAYDSSITGIDEQYYPNGWIRFADMKLPG